MFLYYFYINFFLQPNDRRHRFSHQEDPTPSDSPHPYINQQRRSTSQSSDALSLPVIPPAPPRPVQGKLTPAQIRLRRAINVDKFSRIGFPLIFTVLNCTYWIIFYEYL